MRPTREDCQKEKVKSLEALAKQKRGQGSRNKSYVEEQDSRVLEGRDGEGHGEREAGGRDRVDDRLSRSI